MFDICMYVRPFDLTLKETASHYYLIALLISRALQLDFETCMWKAYAYVLSLDGELLPRRTIEFQAQASSEGVRKTHTNQLLGTLISQIILSNK